MFGNMHPNVVSEDNGPYFVLFRDLNVKYDRESRKIRICVNALKILKLENQFYFYPSCVGVKLIFSSCTTVWLSCMDFGILG